MLTFVFVVATGNTNPIGTLVGPSICCHTHMYVPTHMLLQQGKRCVARGYSPLVPSGGWRHQWSMGMAVGTSQEKSTQVWDIYIIIMYKACKMTHLFLQCSGVCRL